MPRPPTQIACPFCLSAFVEIRWTRKGLPTSRCDLCRTRAFWGAPALTARGLVADAHHRAMRDVLVGPDTEQRRQALATVEQLYAVLVGEQPTQAEPPPLVSSAIPGVPDVSRAA